MTQPAVRRPGRSLDPSRRQAILSGARRVFVRDGFAAGTMDAVAEEAQVGKQTLYRHFGSKEALVTELVRAMCAAAAPSPPGGVDLPDRVRAMLRTTVAGLTTPESLGLYRAIVAEAERMPALARLFWETGALALRQTLAQLLTNTVPIEIANALARQMIQIALGDAYQEKLLDVGPTSDEVFDKQIDDAVNLLTHVQSF